MCYVLFHHNTSRLLGCGIGPQLALGTHLPTYVGTRIALTLQPERFTRTSNCSFSTPGPPPGPSPRPPAADTCALACRIHTSGMCSHFRQVVQTVKSNSHTPPVHPRKRTFKVG